MSIYEYLAQTERTYSYRIKSVVPLVDNDDAMGHIERVLLKYQPVRMDQPRKLMFQKAPLDFPKIENAEIHTIDIELGLPASGNVLMREIADALHVPVSFIVVRGENDPADRDIEESEVKAQMAAEAEKEGAVPAALLDLPNYDETPAVEATDLYGDKYNRRLLGFLKKVEAERAPKPIETKNAPFGWLPKPDVAADAGPTIGTEDGAVAGKAQEMVSKFGNLDDERKPYTRAYQRKGKTFVKTVPTDSVRKD